MEDYTVNCQLILIQSRSIWISILIISSIDGKVWLTLIDVILIVMQVHIKLQKNGMMHFSIVSGLLVFEAV